MTDLAKASNAIVTTVEFYAGALAALTAERDMLLEQRDQLGKQLKQHNQLQSAVAEAEDLFVGLEVGSHAAVAVWLDRYGTGK